MVVFWCSFCGNSTQLHTQCLSVRINTHQPLHIEYVKCNPFDVLSQGCDFFRNFTADSIDYASFQCWPDEWLPEADEKALHHFTERWIGAHASLAKQLGKPLLLSAFGKKPAGAERASHFKFVFSQAAEAAHEGDMAGALFTVVAVPGWQGYYPEYHVFLDAPPPGQHSIRHFRYGRCI